MSDASDKFWYGVHDPNRTDAIEWTTIIWALGCWWINQLETLYEILLLVM